MNTKFHFILFDYLIRYAAPLLSPLSSSPSALITIPLDDIPKLFWKHHCGTDKLVSSYLFLLSGLGNQALTIFRIMSFYQDSSSSTTTSHTTTELSTIAHNYANAFAAIFFVLGSIYFIKFSYPETAMIMIYHAMTIYPNCMSCVERYFTANEMLIALRLFALALLGPYFIVTIYKFLRLQAPLLGVQDFFVIVIVTFISAILDVGAMPDTTRMNVGKGSSFFYDSICVPFFCLNCGGSSSLSSYHCDVRSDKNFGPSI